MKADYATQPADHKFHGITPFQFSFTLRWRNWKITEKGIFRWWGFKAVKANSKGIHAIRYGWKQIELSPSPIRVFRAIRGRNSSCSQSRGA